MRDYLNLFIIKDNKNILIFKHMSKDNKQPGKFQETKGLLG